MVGTVLYPRQHALTLFGGSGRFVVVSVVIQCVAKGSSDTAERDVLSVRPL